MYIGITDLSDASTAFGASGISADPGNVSADANAISASINARGGLFGRQVKVLVHDNATADVLGNPQSAAQANCTYFTQDHPVIALVNAVQPLETDSFRSCFAKAHVPVISLGTAPFDDSTTARLAPYYYNALSVSYSKLAPLLVSRLKAQGYFASWNPRTGQAGGTTKVGVLYQSTSDGTRAGKLVVAALKSAGYDATTYGYQSTSDAAGAELNFAGNGVTHVISTDPFVFYFANAAQSQGYYPRYGVTTYNGIQVLLEANTNPRELHGALGVGWFPSLDVGDAKDPGPVEPGFTSCHRALAAGGQTDSGKRFAQAVGLAICDGIQLVTQGSQAGGGFTPDLVRNGIVKLGSRFATGGSFSSGLSASNFGLPGSARDLGFNAGCSCFAYSSSSSYPIP